MRNILAPAILLATLLIPTLSPATPGILKLFVAKHPATDGSPLADCRTCHLPAEKNWPAMPLH